tara:strand:- start:228 stop:1139 length:912 start_codon:yes stop_codon:yes gene_type:complete
MINSEIIGGVSPLKKKRGGGGKRRRGYAGKAGRKNTATKRGRAGFSKAGPKGVNRHGYGALTRFKPRKMADWTGPLSKATQPKTGTSDGGGTGGGNYIGGTSGSAGGNTYSMTIDNSVGANAFQTNNIVDNTPSGKVNSQIIKENTKTTDLSKNKKEEKKRESYDGFWTSRVDDKSKWSDGMKHYINKHNGDLAAARIEWEEVSRKNEKARHAKQDRERQESSSEESSNQSTEEKSVEVLNNTSGGGSGNITFNLSGATYTGSNFNAMQGLERQRQEQNKKSSPTKMKSHAWDMVRAVRKANK